MFDSPQSTVRLEGREGAPQAAPEYFCVRRGLGLPWKRLPMAARSYAQRFVSGAVPEIYLTNDFAVRLQDRSFALPGAGGLAGAVAAASRPAHATELVYDLRSAFPRLVRRLVEVHCGERITLRFECEGAHDGSWRGLVCATGRYVTFEEHHALTLRGARVASDDVAFDLASILRQVCGQ